MKTLVSFFLFLFLFSACNYEKYRHTFFEGNWILANYVDSVKQYHSIAKVKHTGMQELVFKRHTDSVCVIDNGFEKYVLPYELMNANQLRVQKFNQDEHTDLFINEYAYYLSYDTKGVRYVFVKPDERLIDTTTSDGWPESYRRVLNSVTLAGYYLTQQNDTVNFRLNGDVAGWSQARRYEVCIGGDCRNFYDGDLVQLSSGDEINYYAWELTGNELVLYKLKDQSRPNEMQYYIKDGVFGRLTKIDHETTPH